MERTPSDRKGWDALMTAAIHGFETRPQAGQPFRSPSWNSRRSWRDYLLLGVLSLYFFFYGLTRGELYRTESLRALVASEMLRGGNWVVPTLYGEPLLTKPPGMYVAIAIVSWPLGKVTEWSARLPSALAATGMVFLFYWYFRRHLGRQGGLIAGLVLPVSWLWLDRVPSAEIDMVLVAWVTAAILFFLRALEGENPSPPDPLLQGERVDWWWLAAFLCLTGGFLTKWTAPAFFYLTVIPLLGWRGQLRLLWGRRHLASALLAGGLCLAWIGAAIHQVGWEVFYGTVSQEALSRLSPAHHPKPYSILSALMFPLVFLAASVPWSVLALYSLVIRNRHVPSFFLFQAFHCWIWPNLLFWSLLPEHEFRDVLPIVPAFAGLAALMWVGWLDGTMPRRWKGLSSRGTLVGILIGWLVVKAFFVHVVIPQRQNRDLRNKGEQLAVTVPPGETLHLAHLKDEGIMFYFGRPVRRVAGLDQLTSLAKPVYCILTEDEWKTSPFKAGHELLWLRDGQKSPIVLVRVVEGEQ